MKTAFAVIGVIAVVVIIGAIALNRAVARGWNPFR